MTVGIISSNTQTQGLNVSSILHTYAFQQYLEEKNIRSVVLDYKPAYHGEFDMRHPLFHYVDHPYSDIAKQKRTLKKWGALFFEREAKYDKIQQFIRDYYHITPTCYDLSRLEREDPGCDCYICESDTIWRYHKKTGFEPAYFLQPDTMRRKFCISYAVSCGAAKIPKTEEERFVSLVESLDAVSVREENLRKWLSERTEKPVERVLDPVLLHEKEFYHKLAADPGEEGYVLVFMGGESSALMVREAVRFAEAKNLPVIELGEDKRDETLVPGTRHPVIYDFGVKELIGYIEHASYIFTNSYHGCCLAMLYEKPFIAGPRKGNKIKDLMGSFGLQKRMMGKNGMTSMQQMEEPVDYDAVRKKREAYQSVSEKFLMEALSRVEPAEPEKISVFRRWSQAIKKFLKGN